MTEAERYVELTGGCVVPVRIPVREIRADGALWFSEQFRWDHYDRHGNLVSSKLNPPMVWWRLA